MSLPPTLRLGDAPAFWDPAASCAVGAVAGRVAALNAASREEPAKPAAPKRELKGDDASNDGGGESAELTGRGIDDESPAAAVALLPAVPVAAPVAAQVTPQETATLWHRRLAHPGRRALATAVRAQAVTGVSLGPAELEVPGDHVCEPCIMGKSHLHPLLSTSNPRNGPSDTVVSDLSGMITPAVNGERYAHLMLHLDTNMSLLGFVTTKADVPALVMEQLREMERQIGRKVKVFRSDRGGEYANYKLKDWLWGNGIQHQMALPYIPQQKGAGESTWRGLWARTRAVLHESGLPAAYWTYAAGYVNDCRNALLVAGGKVTPYELFYGRKPNLSRFKPFGCIGYAHIPSESEAPGSKLEPKAVKGRFLGFNEGEKGWVMLQDDGEVVISQSVIFAENTPTPAAARPLRLTESEEEPRWSEAESEADGDGDAPSGGGGGAAAADSDTENSAQRDADADDSDEAAAQTEAEAAAQLEAGRGQRARRLPRRLEGFQVGAAAGAPADPKTYEEAIKSPKGPLWREAMQNEIINMESNGAWELGTPPAGAVPIPAKTVWKTKLDPDGNVTKYKARLVVRGFLERWVGDVFAPASLIATVRTFLAAAAARDLELGSLDVDGAFLKGVLPPGTWIELPAYCREYLSAAPAGKGPVTVHLKKAMYGLKIAPKVWYETLAAALLRRGFKRTYVDPCLFTGATPDGTPIYLLVYVDDVLVACRTKEGVKQGVSAILSEFEGRDLGEPTAFLGMKIERDRARRVIKMSQERHVRELLERFNMADCRPKAVPIAAGRVLAAAGEALDTTAYPYTSLLGGLLYVATHTRPDISYAVGVLARYSQRPTTDHWSALKDVLRYLAGTAHLRLHLGGGGAGGNLLGWCDADWGGDLDSRRSTTGFMFKLGSGAITWSSKRQNIVTLSTAEAEYTAVCSATREALWLRELARALDFEANTVPLLSDSQAAIAMAKTPVISTRTKHMDVRLHYVRERAAAEDISLTYIPTDEMLADPLTKPVTEAKLTKMRSAWGVY